MSYRDTLADDFLEALGVELRTLPPGFSPRTVYVGGGTPSALRNRQLERLLDLLSPFLASCLEYTFEVNPKSATEEKIEILARGGVTRISFGAQTFGDAALALLGRRHRSVDIAVAYQRLRDRIRSVSFDLIFALPGQTLADWQADLAAALELEPDHLSVYALTYEEGTPLTRRVRAGELQPVGEEVEREMFLEASRQLTQRQYEHYEVSSYALAGHRSLHNQGYWNQDDYVGVGPGAVSTLGSRRSVNERNVFAYIQGLRLEAVPPRQVELLSARDALNEHIMLRLRTCEGLSLGEFFDRARMDLDEFSGGKLTQLSNHGLLVCEGGRARLSTEGLCLADSVIAQLMA